MDEPLFRFANTEHAEACGRMMNLTAFPELVREYFATQKELAEVQFEIAGFGGGGDRMDRCVVLATRQQLQREAIEEFLSISAAGHGVQGEPATPFTQGIDPAHETAAAESHLSSVLCPLSSEPGELGHA